MSVLDSFKSWIVAPFSDQQDWVKWVAAAILFTTITWAWTRVLDHVARELD